MAQRRDILVARNANEPIQLGWTIESRGPGVVETSHVTVQPLLAETENPTDTAESAEHDRRTR